MAVAGETKLGPKAVKVHLPASDTHVTIVIDEDTPMYEVKLQLEALTGVPVAAQEVMLQGVGVLVMIDKRVIGATHSATTGSFYLGMLGADGDSNKA